MSNAPTIITDSLGNELPKDPANVKIRLVRTFKLPTQSMADINAECKALTPDDLEWFKAAFNEAGYPCT